MKKSQCRQIRGDTYLVLDDIEIWLGYSDYDGSPMVLIETSPDTDTWEKIRVYLNDGKAVRWE